MMLQAMSIIVVSDDDNFTQAIQAVLEPYGFKVKVAGYCDSCIRFTAVACPELILLDWKWQDLRSSKILNQLKTDEQTKHIPVYALVSDMPGSIIKQSKKLGAAGYFVKSPKHILAQITTGKPDNRFSSCDVKLQRLKQQTPFEQLTNIDSRRFTELHINDCIKQLQRYGWQFGLLLFDIGHLTAFGNICEQDVSGMVLRGAAQTISTNTRSFDHVALWGQREIISTVVNIDDKKLDMIAARLRGSTEEPFKIYNENTVSVRVSVGAAMCQSDDNLGSLLQKAHASFN